MRQNVGHLMTSEIELRQHLSVLERDWLTDCLYGENGVADVKWSNKTNRVFVEHNAAIFESAELLDFLRARGVSVSSLRAGYA